MGLKDRRPTTIEEYINYKIKYNNWDRWGKEDQLGTLNHINQEGIKYANSLVRE